MKPAALVTDIFLFLVAVAHILRLALGTRVTVGDVAVPAWASVPAAVLVGGLAIWLWKEQRTHGAHT